MVTSLGEAFSNPTEIQAEADKFLNCLLEQVGEFLLLANSYKADDLLRVPAVYESLSFHSLIRTS